MYFEGITDTFNELAMMDMSEDVKVNRVFGLGNGIVEKSFNRKQIAKNLSRLDGKMEEKSGFRFGHVTFEMPIRH